MNSFQAFITINKEMNANLYKTIIKLACYIIKACHSYFSGHFLMFSKKLNGLIQVLGRISHVPMNLMTSKSISSYASHLTTHHSWFGQSFPLLAMSAKHWNFPLHHWHFLPQIECLIVNPLLLASTVEFLTFLGLSVVQVSTQLVIFQLKKVIFNHNLIFKKNHKTL